jgi:methionyl aminopeptidase
MIKLKSQEDIEILKEGGVILAAILDDLETLAVAGNTTLDIDDRAMELMEKYGVEPMILGYHAQFAPRPYPAATCVSINDVIVHGIPNEEPIEMLEGDVVSIDAVIAHKGMIVDSARTVGVGKISKEAKQLIHVTKQALEAGIKAAVVGNHIRDIGAAIEKVVPKGYGIIEVFCGHGVGFDLHEDPLVPNFVMKGKSEELIEGMVIAIEPMITLGSKEVEVLRDGYTAITSDGSMAAHVEHTVAITKNGPLILTQSQKKK